MESQKAPKKVIIPVDNECLDSSTTASEASSCTFHEVEQDRHEEIDDVRELESSSATLRGLCAELDSLGLGGHLSQEEVRSLYDQAKARAMEATEAGARAQPDCSVDLDMVEAHPAPRWQSTTDAQFNARQETAQPNAIGTETVEMATSVTSVSSTRAELLEEFKAEQRETWFDDICQATRGVPFIESESRRAMDACGIQMEPMLDPSAFEREDEESAHRQLRMASSDVVARLDLLSSDTDAAKAASDGKYKDNFAERKFMHENVRSVCADITAALEGDPEVDGTRALKAADRDRVNLDLECRLSLSRTDREPEIAAHASKDAFPVPSTSSSARALHSHDQVRSAAVEARLKLDVLSQNDNVIIAAKKAKEAEVARRKARREAAAARAVGPRPPEELFAELMRLRPSRSVGGKVVKPRSYLAAEAHSPSSAKVDAEPPAAERVAEQCTTFQSQSPHLGALGDALRRMNSAYRSLRSAPLPLGSQEAVTLRAESKQLRMRCQDLWMEVEDLQEQLQAPMSVATGRNETATGQKASAARTPSCADWSRPIHDRMLQTVGSTGSLRDISLSYQSDPLPEELSEMSRDSLGSAGIRASATQGMFSFPTAKAFASRSAKSSVGGILGNSASLSSPYSNASGELSVVPSLAASHFMLAEKDCENQSQCSTTCGSSMPASSMRSGYSTPNRLSAPWT